MGAQLHSPAHGHASATFTLTSTLDGSIEIVVVMLLDVFSDLYFIVSSTYLSLPISTLLRPTLHEFRSFAIQSAAPQ